MTNLKISILTTSDFPYGGAAENFVRLMALGFYENGYNPTIILYYGNRNNHVNDTTLKHSNYLFKKPASSESGKIIETILQILYIPFFSLFRKTIKKDHVLILYGLDRSIFNFPLMLFCKLLNIRFIRIITELYTKESFAHQWWRRPNFYFNEWQLKFFDRFADGIVVLTKSLSGLSIENKVNENKIIIIPNFIDFHHIKPGVNSTSRFKIGFCGTLSKENGVYDLIDAYIFLSNKYEDKFELVIIGSIPEYLKLDIDAGKFSKYNIKFIGYLSNEYIYDELSCCNVLVNPRKKGISADTGFPTKLGEYFATKRPVVATKVGDLNAYFTDKSEIVLVEPDNPFSIAIGIDYLYSQPDDALKIGENGYDWAIQNLDYKMNAKKLLDFIYPA